MGFKLPMTMSILSYEDSDGQFVAHALEFDIAAVESTLDKAVEKLRTSLKLHIEYGLNKGWESEILKPAPSQYWDLMIDACDDDHLPERLEPIVLDVPTPDTGEQPDTRMCGWICSSEYQPATVQV